MGCSAFIPGFQAVKKFSHFYFYLLICREPQMPILAKGYGTCKQLTCLRSTSAVLCLRWDLNLGHLIRILRSVPLDYGPLKDPQKFTIGNYHLTSSRFLASWINNLLVPQTIFNFSPLPNTANDLPRNSIFLELLSISFQWIISLSLYLLAAFNNVVRSLLLWDEQIKFCLNR